jgi:hypothetical protein
MNNFIKIQLENFEKPDINFIKDKECLICLESIHLELNEIVKLPCKCTNSVYHIICIETFLKSGENKNFCPHCKIKYVIPINEQIQQQQQQIQQPNIIQLQHYVVINRINESYRYIKLTEIFIFHIISNSIMNIINLLIIQNYYKYDMNNNLQIVSLFYLLKIMINLCFFLFSKNNIVKIENFLICSYLYQALLFGFIIYSSMKIIDNYNIIILIINNIVFSIIDILFRIIREYKSRETQVAIHPI